MKSSNLTLILLVTDPLPEQFPLQIEVVFVKWVTGPTFIKEDV